MSTNDKRTNRPPTPKTKGTTSRAAAAPPKRSPVLLATMALALTSSAAMWSAA